MESDRHEPEDFTGWVRAAVSESEWEIHCGRDGCGTLLADASWFDVQMAMILNSTDEYAARQALRSLPPLHLRRFRMHAQFPPEWSKDDDGVWIVRGPQRPGSRRSADEDPYLQRYIRGRLRQAELSQEATPPARVICPTCRQLQVVPRRARKGTPALAPETKAS